MHCMVLYFLLLLANSLNEVASWKQKLDMVRTVKLVAARRESHSNCKPDLSRAINLDTDDIPLLRTVAIMKFPAKLLETMLVVSILQQLLGEGKRLFQKRNATHHMFPL